MLKNMNLKKEDVLKYVCGEHSPLERTMYLIGANALEGANISRAKFSDEDNKVVLDTIGEMESRIEALRELATEAPSWIMEMLTENKSEWVKEFSKRIDDANSVSEIMKVIDQIDDKIEDINDTLNDDMTLKGFVRKALKAGLIAGALATGIGAVAAAAGVGAIANTVQINRGKSLLRQVLNEMYTLRKKAIVKRDKIRKEEYHDHREGSNDSIEHDDESYGGSDADESGITSAFEFADTLLNM